MANSNVRRGDKGSGADFVNQQRAMDEANNARQRKTAVTTSLTRSMPAAESLLSAKPGVSEKKAGAGKHN